MRTRSRRYPSEEAMKTIDLNRICREAGISVNELPGGKCFYVANTEQVARLCNAYAQRGNATQS
jgi:hypothetical protein